MNAKRAQAMIRKVIRAKCEICGEVHSAGAVKIAAILIGGHKRLETKWDDKSKCGIANMIDRETAAPDMLAALEDMLRIVEYHVRAHTIGVKPERISRARAAIAKAKEATS